MNLAMIQYGQSVREPDHLGTIDFGLSKCVHITRNSFVFIFQNIVKVSFVFFGKTGVMFGVMAI